MDLWSTCKDFLLWHKQARESHGSDTLCPLPFTHFQEDEQAVSVQYRKVQIACYGGLKEETPTLELWLVLGTMYGSHVVHPKGHFWLLWWLTRWLPLLARTHNPCFILPMFLVIPQLASSGNAGPLFQFRTCFQLKEEDWVCRGPYSREDRRASGWHGANLGLLFAFYYGR